VVQENMRNVYVSKIVLLIYLLIRVKDCIFKHFASLIDIPNDIFPRGGAIQRTLSSVLISCFVCKMSQ
ncbi:hypothetical protein L9F63_024839, partial [Diploptera punctata]